MATGLCVRCVSLCNPRYIKHVCGSCLERLENDIKDLDSQLEFERSRNEISVDRNRQKFQSERAFLRLQFDNDLAEGILKEDVTILVQHEQDKPLRAHKIVLANRSSVFSNMFQTEMLESETGTVRIDDATLPVIRAMIRFCYCAEIDFNQEVHAEDVLAVAHKYAIDFLQETCEDYLAETINTDNLTKLLTLAKKFDAKRLQKSALTYLKDNFDRVIVPVLDELLPS